MTAVQRGIVVIAVVLTAAVFLIVGASDRTGVEQSIWIALGCDTLIFLPLLAIERSLTRDLRRTKNLAQQAVDAANQAVEEITQLAREPMSDEMRDAARRVDLRVAEEAKHDQAMAQAAIDNPDAAHVTALMARAHEGGLLGDSYSVGPGIVAPIDSSRRWYLQMREHTQEPGGLRLTVNLHGCPRIDDPSGIWHGEMTYDAAIKFLFEQIHKETRTMPSVPATARALSSLIAFVGHALDQTHRQRKYPLEQLRAPLRDGWFLTTHGLESFDNRDIRIERGEFEYRFPWRSWMRGVPWRVLREARTVGRVLG